MTGRLATATYRLPSSEIRRSLLLRGMRAVSRWLARIFTASVRQAAVGRQGMLIREGGERGPVPSMAAGLAVERTVQPPLATTVEMNVAFDCIVADRTFDAGQYLTVFGELQRGAASKLWDLRSVETLDIDVFERLAESWTAGADRVRQLAVLLDYERWVVFHTFAARRLQQLAGRGVLVEIFYDQQFVDVVPSWFAGGPIEHPVPALLEWLRTDWKPKPNWRRVLDTTAMLVCGFSPRHLVPDQLVHLAAVAVSSLGSDGARVANAHLETALSWVGEQPSSVRCRVLRMRASTLRRVGKTHEAMLTLDASIRTAMLVGDRREEASALFDLGLYMQQGGHLERAERLFRKAVSLPLDDAPFILATLHHQLALVLCEQGKQLDEAQEHAEAALSLRWDRNARLASEDRALLERIRDANSLTLGSKATAAYAAAARTT